MTGARRDGWQLAVLGIAAALVAAHALTYLHARWLSLDRAVFEADVYAQGLLHARATGSYWPWDLTAEFWPFLTMGPGIYLFLPVFALFPGGYATLVSQALGLTVSSLLVWALARRRAPAGSAAPLLLGLAWLLHPLVGVGMAWGWCFYTFGAPLALLGALLLDQRRFGWAAVALLAAASMKINVALGVAGLGLWGLFQRDRPWGGPLLVGTGAWVAVTAALFVAGLLAEGRLSHDLHLGGGGPAPPTAGGLLTAAATLLPVAPLLRRTWLLVLTAAGLELAYTLLVNPANSGLIPATAFLFLAACEGLAQARRPTLAAGAAVVLALVCRAGFDPPVVGPLPLTAAAFAYEGDPDGPLIRAAAATADPRALLVVDEGLMGVIGEHPGPVARADRWDGSRPATVLVRGPLPPAAAQGCASPLLGEGADTVWFGACPGEPSGAGIR